MLKKEEYEVIKFVERGEDCYIVSDYVKGVTLYRWIQLHEEIEKDTLEQWILKLIQQLNLFQKQKGNPRYKYLNPYTLIITEEDDITLLYPEENIPCLRGEIAKKFQLENANQDVDLYCLGRTIQFIMAHIKCAPNLKKREEIKLLIFVKKCLENTHKKQLKQYNKNRTKRIIILLGAIFSLIGIIFLPKKEEKKCESEMDYFSLGMYQFLEKKDYAKSKIYFEKAEKQGKDMENYVRLTEFMLHKSNERGIKRNLQIIEREADKEKDADRKLMLARGCVLIETDWAYEMIVEMYLDNSEELSEERLLEWNEYKALAYEKLSLWKEAGTQYRILKEQEEKRNEREKMYREKFVEMDINYLKELWREETVSAEEKQQVLQNMLKDNPKMKEEESFIQFIQENHIQL